MYQLKRCLLLYLLLSSWPAAADRLQDDHDAKEEFLKLHFFTDGRGMHLTPGLMDILEKWPGDLASGTRGKIFRYRYGLNVIENKPVGLFSVPYEKRHVAVLGCAVCHTGKAAGVFVPGLGNKNIDVLRIGKDAYGIQKLLKPFYGGKKYKEMRDSALQFAKDLSDEKIGNMTQGLVTVSFIRRWFYRQAGLELPRDMTRGGVKVPALWGYEEKRKIGQFSDGFGNGNLPGWAIAVELTGGQTVETVRSYLPKIEAAEALFSYFLPPEYPFRINAELATQGEQVYLKNCSSCHGTYERDIQNLPIFKEPHWIPYEYVKTDYDRLASNTEEFYELVSKNPLSDILQTTNLGKGYFAPRLQGIWSRFPYLHNASVPTIADLLTPPDLRPRFFSLHDAGEAYRFDQERLGLTLPVSGSKDEKKLGKQAVKGNRQVYFTERSGQSAVGHKFGTHLPINDKIALIEYLKTL